MILRQTQFYYLEKLTFDPDSVTCSYLIKSPLNLPMALTFTAFEVEAGSCACYDFVRVSTLRSYIVLLLRMSMLLFEILILI
jgi:hypothetical protein